jgi:hypothetical protein
VTNYFSIYFGGYYKIYKDRTSSHTFLPAIRGSFSGDLAQLSAVRTILTLQNIAQWHPSKNSDWYIIILLKDSDTSYYFSILFFFLALLYPQFGTSPPSATLGRLDTWHGFKKIKPSFYLDFMVIKRGFNGDFMEFYYLTLWFHQMLCTLNGS